MEFLRFGSSIPGGYWGCCACCIIQDFNQDPDAKASIQLVSGDGGGGITNGKGLMFAGPTYRDIFNQRIRTGTFDSRDMPNHAFLAILTENQVSGGAGIKWLKILKETGFEFIRTVSNSVYAGQSLLSGAPSDHSCNYIFGLFRNIGAGAVTNPLVPPKQWTDLPKVAPEVYDFLEKFDTDLPEFNEEQRAAHTEIWNKIGPAKFLSEEEVIAAGAVVTMAGLRSVYPPESKLQREQKKKGEIEMKGTKSNNNPFANASVAAEPEPEYDDFDPLPSCGVPGCTACD